MADGGFIGMAEGVAVGVEVRPAAAHWTQTGRPVIDCRHSPQTGRRHSEQVAVARRSGCSAQVAFMSSLSSRRRIKRWHAEDTLRCSSFRANTPCLAPKKEDNRQKKAEHSF